MVNVFAKSNNRKKNLLSLALFLSSLMLLSSSTLAFNTFNSHKCNRGVNVLYYVYPDAAPFISDINQAAVRWTNTSTKVTLGRTYDTSPSTIDIFYRYDNSDRFKNVNAWTELVVAGHGPVDPTTVNWDYGRVYINDYNMNPNNTRSVAIVEHEMGHVFGLAHSNADPTSIMCQELYGRTATYPSPDDMAGINFLYGIPK